MLGIWLVVGAITGLALGWSFRRQGPPGPRSEKQRYDVTLRAERARSAHMYSELQQRTAELHATRLELRRTVETLAGLEAAHAAEAANAPEVPATAIDEALVEDLERISKELKRERARAAELAAETARRDEEIAQLEQLIDDLARRADLLEGSVESVTTLGALALYEAEVVVEETPESPPPPSAVESPHDDLKLIPGIGPKTEERLNALDITSYRQVANLTDEEVARMSGMLRVGRRQLAKGIRAAATLHLEKYGQPA